MSDNGFLVGLYFSGSIVGIIVIAVFMFLRNNIVRVVSHQKRPSTSCVTDNFVFAIVAGLAGVLIGLVVIIWLMYYY